MQDSTKKILFLYSELAGYTLSCLKLLNETKKVKLYVVCWPVNKEAPFQFDFPSDIEVRRKSEFTYTQLQNYVSEIQPDLICCSGWIDKDYTSICKKYRIKIPVIGAFDNKWLGTLKQYLAILLSPFTIQKYFTHCFVPGDLQARYAERLGFKKQEILKGLYAADVDFYHLQYLKNKENKSFQFPKKFIYVGRYYAFKGIEDLWQAFSDLHAEMPNEWELWCLGTGDLEPFNHPKIKHFGFVQPHKQIDMMAESGVFVLPSRVEPWGVVVHEYAAAGFPLLLSNQVGAAGSFLQDSKNGFLFEASNPESIKNCLKKMILLSDQEKSTMADLSAELASSISPKNWVETIYSVMKEY